MKATLEFDLPEDASEHLQAVHAGDAFSALLEMKNLFREKLKYGQLSDEDYDAIDQIREAFFEIIENHKIENIIENIIES